MTYVVIPLPKDKDDDMFKHSSAASFFDSMEEAKEAVEEWVEDNSYENYEYVICEVVPKLISARSTKVIYKDPREPRE